MAEVQQRAAHLTPKGSIRSTSPTPWCDTWRRRRLPLVGLPRHRRDRRRPRASPAAVAPSCTTPLQLRTIELVRTAAGPAIQVSGIKPAADTIVALVAEDVVYVQPPDYWNYSILGCSGSGPLVPAVTLTEGAAPDHRATRGPRRWPIRLLDVRPARALRPGPPRPDVRAPRRRHSVAVRRGT